MSHVANNKKYSALTHAEFLAAVADGHPVIVVRVKRSLVAGNFADKTNKPFAWAVGIEHDAVLALITSQRKLRREWTKLDSVDDWLRKYDVRQWCVRNALD